MKLSKGYIQNIITVIITAIYNTKSKKWVCNYSGFISIACNTREYRTYVEYFLDRNIINKLEVRKELECFIRMSSYRNWNYRELKILT